MRIHFVDNFPLNFGVSYLSTTLKGAGHEVELHDWQFPEVEVYS